MATQNYQPPAPPSLPSVKGLDDQLANYLRAFSLWCVNGFNNKVTVNVAAPSVLLLASDAPTGTTPKVFKIQVNSAGTISATAVAIGGKQ